MGELTFSRPKGHFVRFTRVIFVEMSFDCDKIVTMYTIIFTKQADKMLRKIPHNVARLIRKKLAQIAVAPYAKHNNVTKLVGRSGFRLRVGDWRVIYEIQNNNLVILVMRIRPRGDVYR